MIYLVDDFTIKIKDNNHIWELVHPQEYNKLDVIIYDKNFEDVLPGNQNYTICTCKICNSYSLRLNKDEYFPFNYEYYTPKQILKCEEYIIKNIIE